jgi:hypothetical protein
MICVMTATRLGHLPELLECGYGWKVQWYRFYSGIRMVDHVRVKHGVE